MLSKIDSDFEQNPRRQQEVRLRPYADEIYRFVFGADINIMRFSNKIILDKEFAIDVQLTLRTGQILLGQEKFLSSIYSKYNSLTVEYKQNENEQGDWFKLAPQIYFTGYECDKGFYPWVLVNWANLVIATLRGEVQWSDNKNKDGYAQASFRYININEIPLECIIARSSI